MPGILQIDHRQGQGIDGKRGTLEEYFCVDCIHCQRVIAILKRGTSTYALSNIDILKATPLAPSASEVYVGHNRCSHCAGHVNPHTGQRHSGAICRQCAALMEVTKECPGPWDAQIERAMNLLEHMTPEQRTAWYAAVGRERAEQAEKDLRMTFQTLTGGNPVI